MRNIYLVRHGETEANKDDVFRGRNEVAINLTGLVQAKETKAYFENIPIDYVTASPSSRAFKTAEIVFPDKEIRREPLLDNLDMGTWAGQPKVLFHERYPHLWQMWITQPEALQFEGGESLGDAYRRVSTFLEGFGITKLNSTGHLSSFVVERD